MNYNDMNDRKLVEHARNGDRFRREFAWSEIYGRYHTRVRGVVSATIKNRADVDDLVQETFSSASTGLPGFDLSKELGPWLVAIANNKILDFYRHNNRKKRVYCSGPILDGQGWIGSTSVSRESEQSDAPLLSETERNELLDVFSLLNQNEQEILVRSDLQEQSHAEIGAELGISEKASRARRFRAIRRAQEIVGVDEATCKNGGQELASSTSSAVETSKPHKTTREQSIPPKDQKPRKVTRMKGRQGPKKSA